MSATSNFAGTEMMGHLFESKLATFFMVRAINAGYQFELTTNNKQVGGMFDDVIFRYEVPDDTPERKHWRYRYVQAKHKVNKTAFKIKASNLLSTSTKDNYSISKYFQSFCKFKARGDDIQDCIICTTIDFDKDDFKNKDGIQLKPVDMKNELFFQFGDSFTNKDGTKPTFSKLELPEEVKIKLLDCCDIRILTEKLLNPAKSLNLDQEIINTYHIALIKEKVIEFITNPTKTIKFHTNFIDNLETLSTGAKKLRQKLCELGLENDLAIWESQWPENFGHNNDGKDSDENKPESDSSNCEFFKPDDIDILAKELKICIKSSTSPSLKHDIFKTYHNILIKENIIDSGIGSEISKTMKFHQDFINDHSLTSGAKELRQLLCKAGNEKKLATCKFTRSANFGKEPAQKLPNRFESSDEEQISNDIRILAEELMTCVTKNRAPSLTQNVFSTYHIALFKENVIEFGMKSNGKNKKQTIKFHKDFIDNQDSLTADAKYLRQMLIDSELDLAKWEFERPVSFGQEPAQKLPNCITKDDVDYFLEKLYFFVNSPKENKLDPIIQRDLSKYYNQKDIKLQFLRVDNRVLDWFKKETNKKPTWLSSDMSKEIILDGVDQTSIDLMEKLGFNDTAIRQMTEKLEPYMESLDEKIIRVSTPTPKWTTVKIISAIEKKLLNRDYWVTSFNSLSESERQQWKNRLELTKDHLFLIVCGENEPSEFNFESLIPDDPMWMGKIIIISEEEDGIKDEINFKDLDKETQSVILNRYISFQEEEIKVGRLLCEMSDDQDVVNLLNNSEMVHKLDKILKFPSILELLQTKEIKIPLLSTFQSEQFLYINRKMKDFNYHQKSWTKELADLTIKTTYDRKTPNSEVWISAWNMANERKSDLWNQMKNLTLNKFQQIPEDEIITSKEYQENGTPVIISAVAGTGKSTVLSNYCTKIKRTEEGKRVWVIPIELANHKDTLSSLDVKPSKVLEFFVKLTGVDESPFAKELLMERMVTGDRIVYMMDGFEEIDSQSQDNVIKMSSFLRLTESARLFVSTRPDSQSKLQDGLFAFAYTLEQFTEQDQIECLTDNWKKSIEEHFRLLNLNQTMNQQEKEAIEKFATILVDRVSNVLKDEDRSFVGIPLHCRILAESYQQLIFEIIQEHRKVDLNAEKLVEKFEDLLKDQSFDLTSLYSLLMKRKLEIFKNKMIKPRSDDGINVYNSCVTIAAKQIKNYLIRMAFSVIGGNVPALMISPVQSMLDQKIEDDELAGLGVRFGLLTEKNNPPRFIHRTYAEYLIADYIYQGFLLDHDHHNYLLSYKDVKDLIVNEMFVINNYEGVRVFFDSMLRGIVDTEKWQRFQSDNNFPSHLRGYKKFLSEELLRKIDKEKAKSKKERYFYDVRQFCGCGIHPRIIKMNFDCLDFHFAGPQKNAKLRSIINAFFDEKEFHIPLIFTHSTEMFQRLLGYYEDDDSSAFFTINGIIDTPSFKKYLVDRGSDESEVAKTLNQMRFDFTKSNQEKFKQHIDENGQEETRLSLILHSLSSDPNQHQLFKDYLDFLLKTFGEDWFARFYREKMEFESEGWPNIENMLEILRNLGRENVLQKISKLILVWYPQLFKNYQPLDPKNEITSDDGTMDINWFLGNPDESQLCRLHRLAFFGDNQTDGSGFLNFLNINLESQDVEIQTLATKVVRSMANDLDGVTPFHLAFIGGHVTLCSRMLQLFKGISTDPELGRNVVQPNGLVSKVMWDAINHLEDIQYRKENHISCSETIKGILGSIKENFGHDFLVELLKESNDLTTSSNFFYKWPMCAKLTYILPCDHLPSLFQILVDDKEIHLSSELIFSYGSKKAIRSIDSDTFQTIYSSKEGRVYWVQHVLGIAPEQEWRQNDGAATMDVEEFESRKLNNEQLAILVEEMTSTDGNGTSFWSQCLEKALREESQHDRHNIFVDIMKILKCIHEELDEIAVGKLLSPNSCSVSIQILDILAGYPDKLSISEEATIQEQLANLLKVHANDKILIETIDSAMSQQSPQILKRFSPYEWSNILLFYLDHAESEKLSTFVNTITALHYNDIAKNIWSYCISKIKYSWEGNQKDHQLAKNLGRILSDILKWQPQPINTNVILLFLQDGGWIKIPSSCKEGIYCFKNENLEFNLQFHYDRSLDISQLYSDLVKSLKKSVRNKKRLALTRDFEFVKRSGFGDGLLSEAAELWKQDSIAYGMINPEEKEIRNLVGSLLDYFNEL